MKNSHTCYSTIGYFHSEVYNKT